MTRGSVTGGSATGGSATRGSATRGSATGGSATGGSATGGSATGGSATGGVGMDAAGHNRLDLATVYDAYAPFIWRSLQRMGVPESDLEDALQEVFLVVHRKLDTYEESRAKLSTWLFGIGINIARRHRAKSRTLQLGWDTEQTACEKPTQDMVLQRKEAAQVLNYVLGRLRPEHSATFVMFELEGLSCNEIADLTGVPVGTVYSRLHKARDQFQLLAQKYPAQRGSLRSLEQEGEP